MGTNHICGTAEATVIKFCTPVGYIKSQHMADKSPLKGRRQGHVTRFLNFAPIIIGNGEARHFKFRLLIET